ncbi:MAG: DNA-processing protein DprA, partial [Lachnospiraceae bacterium]|nr:DNA-processing protein DprA [Lachnospiraceae bacterium]
MRYQYWLARLSGIGNATKRRLLKRFRSCEAVYQADREAYQKSGILRAQAAEYVETQKNLWDLDGEYERFLEKKIALLTMETEDYPLRLTKIQNAPFALYYRGRMPEAGETLIAMVGARRASAYGKIMAEEIANSLAKA